MVKLTIIVLGLLTFAAMYPFYLIKKRASNSNRKRLLELLENKYPKDVFEDKISSLNGKFILAIRHSDKKIIVGFKEDKDVVFEEHDAKEFQKFDAYVYDKFCGTLGSEFDFKEMAKLLRAADANQHAEFYIRLFVKNGPIRGYRIDILDDTTAALVVDDISAASIMEKSINFFTLLAKNS